MPFLPFSLKLWRKERQLFQLSLRWSGKQWVLKYHIIWYEDCVSQINLKYFYETLSFSLDINIEIKSAKSSRKCNPMQVFMQILIQISNTINRKTTVALYHCKSIATWGVQKIARISVCFHHVAKKSRRNWIKLWSSSVLDCSCFFWPWSLWLEMSTEMEA